MFHRNFLVAVAICLLQAPLAGISFADELPFWLGERKIQGENNLQPIEKVTGSDEYEYSRVIARVEWQENSDGFCTASARR